MLLALGDGRVLLALGDGRALPAGRLAAEAGVTPATASSHLAKLVAGGLLNVEHHGRHRYIRLSAPKVAELIEVPAREPILGSTGTLDEAAGACRRRCRNRATARAYSS